MGKPKSAEVNNLKMVFVAVGVAIILCGLGVVLVWFVRGDIFFMPLRGESPETRRAVRLAIREGKTDDARVDQLARRVIRMTPSLRWGRYFLGAMLIVSIFRLIAGSHQISQIAVQLSQVGLWTGFIVLHIGNQRRYDRYRGLNDEPLSDRVPPAAH